MERKYLKALYALLFLVTFIFAVIDTSIYLEKKAEKNKPKKVLREPHDYDYVMDSTIEFQLLSKIQYLKKGDLRKTVIEQLGTPTKQGAAARKENNEIISRDISYYLKRYDSSAFHYGFDSYFTITFSKNDSLESYVFKNVSKDKLERAGIKIQNNELYWGEF